MHSLSAVIHNVEKSLRVHTFIYVYNVCNVYWRARRLPFGQSLNVYFYKYITKTIMSTSINIKD